jgi:trehalose synthase-fused probable maltokinase
LILKLFRKIDRGRNPDFEISTKLTDYGFAHGAPVAGVLEYQTADAEPWTLGLLQRFVPNQGDAWQHTLGKLASLLAKAGESILVDSDQWPAHGNLFAAANDPIPPGPRAALDATLRDAELLGRRTAEMHHTLAAVQEDPAFAPQPFTARDARIFHDRALELLGRSFATLRKELPSLSERLRLRAESVLAQEAIAAAQFDQVLYDSYVAKIRCHGDYHLGQVLVSRGDFVIIDFEGEPARPLDQRRQKQLALRDVAGMLRSFHYAACTAATTAKSADPHRTVHIDALSRDWLFWTSVSFVASYRHAAGAAAFVPASNQEFERLLDACRLEKAIYELLYELNNRPEWVYLPLEALDEMLNPVPDST